MRSVASKGIRDWGGVWRRKFRRAEGRIGLEIGPRRWTLAVIVDGRLRDLRRGRIGGDPFTEAWWRSLGAGLPRTTPDRSWVTRVAPPKCWLSYRCVTEGVGGSDSTGATSVAGKESADAAVLGWAIDRAGRRRQRVSIDASRLDRLAEVITAAGYEVVGMHPRGVALWDRVVTDGWPAVGVVHVDGDDAEVCMAGPDGRPGLYRRDRGDVPALAVHCWSYAGPALMQDASRRDGDGDGATKEGADHGSAGDNRSFINAETPWMLVGSGADETLARDIATATRRGVSIWRREASDQGRAVDATTAVAYALAAADTEGRRPSRRGLGRGGLGRRGLGRRGSRQSKAA